MNILFLAHRIPYPPDKGEKIRAYQELRFLAQQHTVDLFAFADPEERSLGRAGLAPLCRGIYLEPLNRRLSMARAALSLLTGEPFTTAYYRSVSMARSVSAALSRTKYDVLFVYCSAMAPYIVDFSRIPVCVDFVDSDASKWAQYSRHSRFPMSMIYEREARKLGEYERHVARSARLSLVSTPLEVEMIDPDGELGVRALQNGVTTATPHSTAASKEIASLGKYVVFVGQMDYLPNVDAACYFAEEILPRIRATHPELRFAIVGRNPSRRVRRLAALPGTVVIGAVPEVQPYLKHAIAAVAPFRICQGVQNKILEALAIGLPVVATPRPARAVGAGAKELLFVAEGTEEFAQTVRRLLEDPGMRQGVGGKEFVERQFNWETNLRPLNSWIREAASAGGGVSDEAKDYVVAS